MTIIKNLIVAFSIYSKIPMPIFEWQEKDMKHNIVFLPFVGIVIGGLSCLAYTLLNLVNAPVLMEMAVLALLPILVTGGFHLDGFMDVRDALSSYASPEKKLEILKDPHIGAFAVIHLAALGLVWMGALTALGVYSSINFVFAYSISFAIGRAVSGAISLKFKKAKKDGMLNMETKAATNVDFVILVIEAAIGVGLMVFASPVAAVITLVDIVIFTFYVKHMAYKNFGGVTGDVSGFSIVSLETLIIFSVAVACLCV